jgi:hypothetical protein
VVRVAIVNGVVKIEDQTPRESPENFDLPRGQKTALNNHRIESAEPPKLPNPRNPPARYYLDLKRSAVGAECRPESADSVTAADVIGRFDQRDRVHLVISAKSRS